MMKPRYARGSSLLSTIALYVLLFGPTSLAYAAGGSVAETSTLHGWALLPDAAVKAIPGGLISLVVLLLGWFVGSRLTAFWSLRQKEREFDLETAREFHRLYGEFFALWKQWEYLVKVRGDEFSHRREEFLSRASAAEGGMEAIFVRIASVRRLSETDVSVLGKYRQAYQSLREAIRDELPLLWKPATEEHYVAFKRLGQDVSQLIARAGKGPRSGISGAMALLAITDSQWETNWWEE